MRLFELEQKPGFLSRTLHATIMEDYFNEENELLQKGHLKSHVSSITKHIGDLGDKNYQKLYKKLL